MKKKFYKEVHEKIHENEINGYILKKIKE